jgi:ATP-dependent Lon protease
MIRRIGREEELRWNVHYHYEEKAILTDELKAYSMAIINSVKDLMKLNPMFVEQLKMSLIRLAWKSPGCCWMCSFDAEHDPHRLQELIETVDSIFRAEKLLLILKEEIQLHSFRKNTKTDNERFRNSRRNLPERGIKVI